MFVAATVCPHPPLLVPGVAAGASAELDGLRDACDAAVAALLAVDTDLVIVVGSAPAVGPYADSARGSLRSYGRAAGPAAADWPELAADAAGSAAADDPGAATLPLALTIGSWLLDRAGATGETLRFGVPGDAESQRCLDLGEALAGRAGRVGLLVMGDGSARRTPKGPGYLDPRAEPFDDAVAAALRAGDTAALAALDAHLAEELLVAGRAPWHVLAGAARGTPLHASVTWTGAPYGVAYVVATWVARNPAG